MTAPENIPVSTADFPRWSSYVAMGDSFTEGLSDEYPDSNNRYRGWADQLAGILSARRTATGQEPLAFANRAVRGRLLRPILGEQLGQTLAEAPGLVSLVGGGNDILRPVADVDELAFNLDAAVARLRAAGSDVLLATAVDPVGAPIIRRTRGRVSAMNAHIWSIARRHGAHVLDQWGMRSLLDLRLWAPDRIHLTTDGHRRVAQAALVALGQPVDDPGWDTPLPPLEPITPSEKLQDDSEWFQEHAVPWATRRLHRQSSGDERVPKRPELEVIGDEVGLMTAPTRNDASGENTGPGSGADSSAEGSDAGEGKSTLEFGETFTYDDGLAITVSAPEAYEPSEYAAGGKEPSSVKFAIKIVNGGDKEFSPSLVYVTVRSGGKEASSIYDSANGIDSAPSTDLFKGDEVEYAAAFGVEDPADITLQFGPGAGMTYETVTYKSGP